MKGDVSYKAFLVDGVIGTRDHIERILSVKGLSPSTLNDVINKIEVIIALSGSLGKLLQREKDLVELNNLKLENNQLRTRN